MPEAAYKCPMADCSALLAEKLVGDPKAVTTMLCHECGRVSPMGEWQVGAWEPATFEGTDTKLLGGGIEGPKDVPYERDTQVIDTRRSVLLRETDVAMMENGSDGMRFATVLLTGRINRSQDTSKVLYLMNEDGLAAIVSECVSLAVREGGEFERVFRARMAERMESMGELV